MLNLPEYAWQDIEQLLRESPHLTEAALEGYDIDRFHLFAFVERLVEIADKERARQGPIGVLSTSLTPSSKGDSD